MLIRGKKRKFREIKEKGHPRFHHSKIITVNMSVHLFPVSPLYIVEVIICVKFYGLLFTLKM